MNVYDRYIEEYSKKLKEDLVFYQAYYDTFFPFSNEEEEKDLEKLIKRLKRLVERIS